LIKIVEKYSLFFYIKKKEKMIANSGGQVRFNN